MGKVYIGIDFGGTNIRFIVYNQDLDRFEKFEKKEIIIFDGLLEEVDANIVSHIKKIADEQKEKGNILAGIGLSLAARFNSDTGEIEEWSNNPKYKGFSLQKYLRDIFDVTVVQLDDANAATLGEHWFGKGKGSENFVYITVGTGIGCGMIVQNKLLLGQNGWAGEIGHIQVAFDKGYICSCGKEGCLQAVSSGKAIYKNYKKRFTSLYGANIDAKNSEEVFNLAQKGNAIACDIVNEAADYLGKTIANMAIILDVLLFVIGGGVACKENEFTKAVIHSMNKCLQGKREVEIKISELNDKNGAIGVIKWMI